MQRITAQEGRLYAAGRPCQFLGFNCYYLMVYAAEPRYRERLLRLFDAAAGCGMRLCRTWAFNDGAEQWHSLQPRPGEHQERILQGLDWVVEQLAERGIYVILTLVNYWRDYGGMDQYVEWACSSPGEVLDRATFYGDGQIQQWYGDHVRGLLLRENTRRGCRYADDPAILAWELANEPRAVGEGAGEAMRGWIGRASAQIRELAPQALITVGSEGFFAGQDVRNPRRWPRGQGCSFVEDHRAEAIDLAGFHLWPDHWQESSGWGVEWIEAHLSSAQELGKPVLLGEFGLQAGQEERVEVYRRWLELFFAHRQGSAALLWTLYDAEYPDYDGFGVYLERERALGQMFGQVAMGLGGVDHW